jgi:hypothetical protein
MDGILARTKAETSSAFAFSAFVAERVALGSIFVLRPSDRLSMCLHLRVYTIPGQVSVLSAFDERVHV